VSTEGHVVEEVVKQFCALRADKCGCGNKYLPNGLNKARSWKTMTFQSRSKRKEGGFNYFVKHPESHHLVCVSSVRKKMIANMLIRPLIEQTKWCANAKRNMRPLPLWGHTIQHYCMSGATTAPKFADNPQHNKGHNKYLDEMDQAVRDVASEVEEKMEEHKITPKQIAQRLNGLSDDFSTKLTDRGGRQKGTHAAWMAGKTNPRWMEPFSMASDGDVEEQDFPPFDEETGRWIDKIKEAMWGAP